MTQKGVSNWSTVAASNNTSDANNSVGWSEGQAPSTVNDSARAMMSSVALWRDDITGVIVTTGSGTAFVLATNQVFSSNAAGYTVQFVAGLTNTGAVTLAVDGNTAKPLRFLTGIDLPSGVLISGSLYQATFRAASDEWLLHSTPLAAPFIVPLGGIIDYTGASAPSSNFALPQGQAISRTTYATLFSLISTTYGVGDNSTTFNIPDLTGRTVYMKEVTATRLTTGTVGIDGGTMGAVGGGAQTLVAANLPAVAPTGTVTTTSTFAGVSSGQTPASLNSGSGAAVSYFAPGSFATITATSSFTGANLGSSTPVKMAASGIILNKIMRIL